MHLGVVVLLLLPLCVSVQLEWIAGVGATGGIGLNYGSRMRSGAAKDLVELVRSRGIGKIRLHDADSTMLRAISTSKNREAPIDVIVGVRNEEIADVGVSPASARSWIAKNVMPYFPATNIIAIAVGNEVLTSRGADDATTVPFLVPAMKNLYAALSEVGLEKQIKVSAPQSARVLSSYFPLLSASFDRKITDRVMAPLLEFLAISGSYFMLNLYPLDLQHHPTGEGEQLEAVFSAGGIDDPDTGRHYSSMFEVLTDALSVAMASAGHHQPSVVGIEMEWSGTSVSSSNAFLIDNTPKGLAVDIGPKFGGHLVINNPPKVEKKIRAKAFSSRRFLSDVLQSRPESGKRRKLGPNKSWCVANPTASTDALQSALDWACGPGSANCEPIQVGQPCFLPNTVVAHASYAFNSYYQKLSWASGSCDFGGIAQVTTSDPSTASCLYSSSTSANGTPSTPTGTVVPNVASRLAWDRCRFMLTSFILIFLIKRTLSDLKI